QLGGQIHIQLIEAANKEAYFDSAIPHAVRRIANLKTSGYALSDICVLVRNNKEGVEITNALLSGLHHPAGSSFPVISNESLILSISAAFQLIIEQLGYVQNPENELSEAFIRLHLFKQPQGNNPINRIDLTLPFHGS